MSLYNNSSAQWKECQQTLRQTLNQETYDTWFSHIEFVSFKNNELSLKVPSPYYSQYLEQNYAKELGLALGKHFGTDYTLYFLWPETNSTPKSIPQKSANFKQPTTGNQETTSEPLNSFLNDRLTFDTFYQSECNRVARSVAEGVAAKPGNAPTNPYFIYGPCGVGKTHLCHAIGHRVKELYPHMRVLYVSSSDFEAQYVNSSRFHERTDFIHFYQQIDVLIVDDIQGLIGKTKTQQAFFEIFNHLKLLNKQIILSSDKAPAFLEGMEARLISRIKGSVAMPLDKPDMALRLKILREKVNDSGAKISENVINFIAENVKNNIRELEGSLCSLQTYALLQPQMKIDLPFARSVISNTVSLEEKEITMERIQEGVSSIFNVDQRLIKDKTRRQDVVSARQAVMYLAKQYTNQSLAAIGEMLGRRNHSTVLHGYNTARDRMKVDSNFRKMMTQVKHILQIE